MPSLSLIANEAHHLLKSLKEAQRREMQEELAALCEVHWRKIRGDQPSTILAQALWSITPPWSDLLLDLYFDGDARLFHLMPKSRLSNTLALLVLAEIERGNEMGVYLAHEPMMAFEETAPSTGWLKRIASLLRGTLTPPLLHHHDRHDTLWKALALIAEKTHRLDLPAIMETITLLATPEDKSVPTWDNALEALRNEILEAGIRFLGIENDHVQFELHGHPHKPARTRQLGEMLLEIRQKWLH